MWSLGVLNEFFIISEYIDFIFFWAPFDDFTSSDRKFSYDWTLAMLDLDACLVLCGAAMYPPMQEKVESPGCPRRTVLVLFRSAPVASEIF